MHKTIRLTAKLKIYYTFSAILANETTRNTESTNNLKPFVDQYSWKKNYLAKSKGCEKFERYNRKAALKIFFLIKP